VECMGETPPVQGIPWTGPPPSATSGNGRTSLPLREHGRGEGHTLERRGHCRLPHRRGRRGRRRQNLVILDLDKRPPLTFSMQDSIYFHFMAVNNASPPWKARRPHTRFPCRLRYADNTKESKETHGKAHFKSHQKIQNNRATKRFFLLEIKNTRRTLECLRGNPERVQFMEI